MLIEWHDFINVEMTLSNLKLKYVASGKYLDKTKQDAEDTWSLFLLAF